MFVCWWFVFAFVYILIFNIFMQVQLAEFVPKVFCDIEEGCSVKEECSDIITDCVPVSQT